VRGYSSGFQDITGVSLLESATGVSFYTVLPVVLSEAQIQEECIAFRRELRPGWIDRHRRCWPVCRLLVNDLEMKGQWLITTSVIS
jgi:hypothetical protein